MRTPSDLPRRRRLRGLGDRGRIALIVAAVLLVVLLLSARFLSGFYIDYLWHRSVGRGDVFWGVMGSKIVLFVMFAAVFIALIPSLGMYIASAGYVLATVGWQRKLPLWKTGALAVVVPLFLFFVFEKLFVVTLPHGALLDIMGL